MSATCRQTHDEEQTELDDGSVTHTHKASMRCLLGQLGPAPGEQHPGLSREGHLWFRVGLLAGSHLDCQGRPTVAESSQGRYPLAVRGPAMALMWALLSISCIGYAPEERVFVISECVEIDAGDTCVEVCEKQDTRMWCSSECPDGRELDALLYPDLESCETRVDAEKFDAGCSTSFHHLNSEATAARCCCGT
jgi:hypothetical protein